MAEYSFPHAIKKIGLTALGNSEELKSYLSGGIEVGTHTVVRPLKYRVPHERKLSDGSVIEPGQVVGAIDFIRNIPRLDPDTNLIGFSRELFQEAKQDLETLASLCENHDPRLDNVIAFSGISHLAGSLAKRLGFDIFEVTNPLKKFSVNIDALGIAKKVAGNNEDWKRSKQNFKPVHEAFISREKLVTLFGTKAIAETLPSTL